MPGVNFECVIKELSDDSREFFFPIYAIELKRFYRVIKKIDTCRFEYSEIKKLAEHAKSLFHSKKHGDFILYKRFLCALRGATMSADEIKV